MIPTVEGSVAKSTATQRGWRLGTDRLLGGSLLKPQKQQRNEEQTHQSITNTLSSTTPIASKSCLLASNFEKILRLQKIVPSANCVILPETAHHALNFVLSPTNNRVRSDIARNSNPPNILTETSYHRTRPRACLTT